MATVPHTSIAYRLLARSVTALVPAAAPFHPKLARGHRGRQGSVERMQRWSREQRDRNRPLVWFHAPSVGEGLQARAVLEWLRARHSEWQVAFTHFSPSAEALARSLAVDVADYLPYDLPLAIDRTLEALAPAALIFAKLDVWPELACRAAARGVAVGLVAGTVSPVSRRTAWPWRGLTRPGYRALAAAGAVAADDAERLIGLGVHAERVVLTGDPRYDSVLGVVGGVPDHDPVLEWRRGGPALVAGSTWPPDERVLLEAFVRVRQIQGEARLILAPHEPTPEHLAGVDHLAHELGLPEPHRLSNGINESPLVVVDRVGVLARLYAAGRIAYVGGGFGKAGLHSVLEPAAWSLPVVYGPRWQNSRDAGILAAGGAGFPLRSTNPAAQLAALWNDWLGKETIRRDVGERARAVVQQGAGAAERSARLVEQLVMGRLTR